MIDDENRADPHQSRRGPLGTVLLCLGTLTCLLMMLDEISGLPFSMPRSWYHYRSMWLGLAVAALIGGFLLLTPPKGDEGDTA